MSTLLWAHGPYPEVPAARLPAVLRQQWNSVRPEFTDNSHCAAAYDGDQDPGQMVFRCSVYIRMAHEGARRAMAYCEEERQRRHVRGPCRLVTP